MIFYINLIQVGPTVSNIHDWTIYCIVTFVSRYLPESPRWLMSQGRYDEVNKIMQNCALVNGKTLPDELLAHFKVKCRQIRCLN